MWLMIVFFFTADDDERDSMGHLPRLLEKMAAVHGHKEALLRTLAFFDPA